MNLSDLVVPVWVKPVTYAILAVSLVVGVYYGLHKAYTWAYMNGVTATDKQWLARENTQIVAANSRIVQLETDARKKEHVQSVTVANIVDNYETEKRNAKVQTDVIISTLNSSIVKLRDKYATTRSNTCADQASATTTGTGSDNAKTGTELSNEATEFLFKLTGEANEVVLQLTACQALLVSDRQTCNANP